MSEASVMNDDDFEYLKTVFTSGNRPISSAIEACDMALVAAHKTHLHIDLFSPRHFSTHREPYGKDSYYVEYDVYNEYAGKYDIKLRIGKHPDGSFSLKLVRPNELVDK